jgi:predicted deacylase
MLVRLRSAVPVRRSAHLLAVGALIGGLLAGSVLSAGSARAAAPTADGAFVTVAPTRLLDTRSGNGAPTARIAAGQSITVQFTDRSPVPAANVGAVAAAVTVVAPAGAGTLTAAPASATANRATIINFAANRGITNTAVLPLGTGTGTAGKVVFTNVSTASIDLVADVTGYYLGAAGTPPTGSGAFGSVASTRLLDTRSGNGASAARVAAGASITVTFTGRSPIPATDVSAVVAAVTVVTPSTGGTLVVAPAGVTTGKATVINFAANQGITDTAVLTLGTSGTNSGKVTLTNSSGGSIDLVADVSGYFLSGTATAAGTFAGVTPVRLLDTRSGNGAAAARVAAGATITVTLGGRGGLAATGVSAVVAAVTVVTPSGTGTLVTAPSGSPTTKATIINFAAPQGITATAVLPVSTDGKVTFTNVSGGTVDLVADVVGFDLASPGRPAAVTATPTMTTVALAWTNPADADLVTTTIVRAAGSIAPATPTSGTVIATLPASTTTTTDTGLIAGSPYAYSMFAKNASGSYSAAAIVTTMTVPRQSALTWGTPQLLDNPQGNPTSVSCVSSSFCAAVDVRGSVTLYDGTSWSPPTQITGGIDLYGVSCVSASFCLAATFDSVTTFDGTTWSALSSTPLDKIDSIDCASTTRCVVVGNGEAAVYNGSTWAGPVLIAPADTFGASQVSCPSTTMCASVTATYNSSTGADLGYASVLTGNTWSTPQIADSVSSLLAVSCASASACVATDEDGYVLRYTGTWSTRSAVAVGSPLVAVACLPASTTCITATAAGTTYRSTNSGASWTSIGATFTTPDFAALTCAPTATFCVAVNQSGYATMLSGTTWSTPTVIDPGQGWLVDISCPTDSYCQAIDSTGRVFTRVGATWSAPVTLPDGQANAISCASTTTCIAATSGGVAKYAAGVWSAGQAIGGPSDSATDVSCPSTTFCMAVTAAGYATPVTNGTPGTSALVDGSDGPGLTAVSCASASYCVAVDNDGEWLLYNGTTWSAPAPAAASTLYSISCPAVGFCAATTDDTTIAMFNGSTWSTENSHLGNGFGVGVACASATFCVALGSGGQATTFDGASWSSPATVNAGNHLSAASCPTAQSCLAVDIAGHVTAGSG